MEAAIGVAPREIGLLKHSNVPAVAIAIPTQTTFFLWDADKGPHVQESLQGPKGILSREKARRNMFHELLLVPDDKGGVTVGMPRENFGIVEEISIGL
ncbi:MAG: hypothetical protein SGARI_002878, partial [Bacillariaceae sp.]